MSHWKETAEILSHFPALAATKNRAALATVVRIAGSAYRRPGAKLLVFSSGDTLGSVSGGCLEADVREVAKAVMESSRPWLRHYNAGDDDDVISSLGLGCNGQVDILVQPTNAGALASLHKPLARLLAEDSPLAIATVVTDGADIGATMAIGFGDGQTTWRRFGSLGSADLDNQAVSRAAARLADGHSGLEHAAGRQVFIEVLRPPPHLLVCGAGADAIPLVAYAADAGFRVHLLDHRQGLLQPALFPQAYRMAVARPEEPEAITLPPAARTLAVVKTHSLAHDRDWVGRLLEWGGPYIGVLGPRERTERILEDIGAEVTVPGSQGRVFGPVGLDIGADGPQQVAISIVAEMLAFISEREPKHLRQREQAIHAD
jgi:xanthine/CO dehydrogenase XdhC/CoxF family maturation factor